jgi:GNAT superfamily N-acetyltransferase
MAALPEIKLDPACRSAVAALEHDPFYLSISSGLRSDVARRRAVLAQYFGYSIQEGKEIGRSIHLEDRSCGVAVWLVPQPPEINAQSKYKKRLFLQCTLGAEGCEAYHRIVEFMSTRAKGLVPPDAWYLSIVAVDPALQGRGLGRKLLEPALSEAGEAGATCYLETFSPRNMPFYERLGFAAEARFLEPFTAAEYVLMVRPPALPRNGLSPATPHIGA